MDENENKEVEITPSETKVEQEKPLEKQPETIEPFFNISEDGSVIYPENVEPAEFDLGILRRRKHNRFHAWKSIIAFVLGGITFVSLPLVALSSSATSVKSGDVLKMLQIDPSTVLTETYQDKTILSIIVELASGEQKLESINDVSQITPFLITSVVDPVFSSLSSYNIAIDKEELCSVSFADIPTYLLNAIESTSLPDLLSGFGMDLDNEIIQKILYVDYPTNSIGRSIDGFDGLDFDAIMASTTVGDVITITDETGFLAAIKDCHLNEEELSEAVATIKLKDLVNIQESDHLLSSFADCYLISKPAGVSEGYTLQEKLNVATLDELIEIDDDPDSPNYDRVLACIKDATLSTIADRVRALTFKEVFSDYIFENDGSVKNTWKYLLTEPGTKGIIDGRSVVDTYTISDCGKMVENLRGNLEKATLSALYNDHFISENETTEQTLKTTIAVGNYKGRKIGDLSTSELISYVGELTNQNYGY